MGQTDRTFIAFQGVGDNDPGHPDSELILQIKAWTGMTDEDFWYTHRNDKASAVAPDPKLREILRSNMAARMKKSRHLLVILDKQPVVHNRWLQAKANDWLSMEICYAVDECKIPIIAAYRGIGHPILQPKQEGELSQFWPKALQSRIINRIAGVMHIPFMAEPLKHALNDFNAESFPNDGALGWYTEETYASWGIEMEVAA